ncbi:MAG: hypothetical protein IJ678_07740 [Kiritimatiellae bacterium]|nr:hypothetical protein [Kiritimatiellia bacterium]
MEVGPGGGAVFDVGFNATGFICAEIECTEPGTIWIAFDEILDADGLVSAGRLTTANAVRFDLAPGRHAVESFEPYTFRYLHAFAVQGRFAVSGVRVRTYRSPAADAASFRSSDPDADRIFAAARETFAQNAVDVFTDCPSRERAGWLCDSFFIGRASALLTGSTDLERLFLGNYAAAEKFEDIPDGMLPMLYPGDSIGGLYIPNWAMWFAIEAAEYLERSGDRATVDALKPRLLKLVELLWRKRGPEGMLEYLDGWVFVEWSKANEWVGGANFPTNATWAAVLDAMDRMYGMPELAAEAERVRAAVRRLSFDGAWFRDNAVRGADGALAAEDHRSETCQYYMFFFGVATPQSHPALWRTLLDDFGPGRAATGKHAEIAPSNAFIGNFLRLELLSRAGLGRKLFEESKGYFGYMAARTGTLWEMTGDAASCNHGFASHVAVFYARNLAGIEKTDLAARRVSLAPRESLLDLPLEHCEATLPLPGGKLEISWRKTPAGGVERAAAAPEGWVVE